MKIIGVDPNASVDRSARYCVDDYGVYRHSGNVDTHGAALGTVHVTILADLCVWLSSWSIELCSPLDVASCEAVPDDNGDMTHRINRRLSRGIAVYCRDVP